MNIKSICAIGAALFAAATANSLAQEQPDASTSIFGVAMGANVDTAKATLHEACGKVKTKVSKTPKLPIARNSETQLVCLAYKKDGIEIAEAAFIFGDDVLSMVEAYGGATAAYETLPGEILSYSGFAVKRELLALGQPELDRLLLMSPDAVRAHMHYWKSAYLPTNKGAPKSFSTSAAQPAIIRFGARSEILRPEFEKDCTFLAEQNIAEPWLATEPEMQTQLDCFGYVYAGFPRKIEAIFGDGALEQVWILTAAAEEARIRKSLSAEYGPAEIVNEIWEVFAGGTVALRKDKPEVLLLSERVAPAFRSDFENARAE